MEMHPETDRSNLEQVQQTLEEVTLFPSPEIKQVLLDSSERLYTLLFDQTEDYTGPLSDGFQIEDIMTIVQITGNWLLGSYTTVLHLGNESVDDFYNTQTLVDFCIEFILLLQKNEVLHIELTHRFMLKTITKLFHCSMDEMLTMVQSFMVTQCSCFSSQSKREKRVNRFIQEKTEHIAHNTPSKLTKK